MTWIKNQATFLKVAAVAIAIPRYGGAFALSVGFYLTDGTNEYLGIAEIIAGVAMAILEGFAIAFILNKWRLLKANSAAWYALAIVILLLALSMPLVAVPYLYFMQSNLQAVSDIFPSIWLQIGWNFTVAGVPMLVVIGVGLADVNELQQEYREVDFELKVSRRKAALQVELSKLELEVEQARVQNELEKRRLRATHKIQISNLEQTVEDSKEKPFICPHCKEIAYETERQLRGHMPWCKKKYNEAKDE